MDVIITAGGIPRPDEPLYPMRKVDRKPCWRLLANP